MNNSNIPTAANEILKTVENVKRNFEKKLKEHTVFIDNGIATNMLGTCGFHSEAFLGVTCGVDCDSISKVLKKLKKRLVILSVADSKLFVETVDKKISLSYVIGTKESENLYKNIANKDDISLDLSSDDIKIIKDSKKFTTKDELRPTMCCTALSTFGDCVSTSGFTLVFKKLSNKPEIDYLTRIVPIEKCSLRLCITPYISNKVYNKYTYSNGDFEIEEREIGNYPKYKSVIPITFTDCITMGKDDIMEAIDLLMLSDSTHVHIVKSVDNVQVCGCDDEDKLTNNTIQLDDCTFSGNEKQIGFKIEWLLKVLKDIADDTISIRYNEMAVGQGFPVVINGTHLVMPNVKR